VCWTVSDGESSASGWEVAVGLARWVGGIVRTAKAVPEPREQEITEALAERAREFLGDRAQVEANVYVISLKGPGHATLITPVLTLRRNRGPGGVERVLRHFGAVLRAWPDDPVGPDDDPDDWEAEKLIEVEIGDETVSVSWDAPDGTVVLKPFARAELGL